MVIAAMAFSASSYAAPPNNNTANQNRMAQQPTNDYWQAPNWPGAKAAPAYDSSPSESEVSGSDTSQRPPARSNDHHVPAYPGRPPGPYGQAYPSNNYPAQNNYPPAMNQSGWNRGAPPQQMQNTYRGNPYPPQHGPYPGANRYQYHPSNAGAAYNRPGYGPYGNNNARNNNLSYNRFWGNSGPNRWMNPNKGNMGQGWNDMTNGPGRMGEMPGGWRAPQISTPNPVDMGEQVQDNAGNLPDQMRDMRR